MNKEKEIWRRTSPLAALFYLGKVFEHITQNMTQTLVPLMAFLLAAKGDIMYKAGLAAVAFILIVLTISLLRYWFFGFRVVNDSIFIREGVIRKTQVDIKFDRIQAINMRWHRGRVFPHLGNVWIVFVSWGAKANFTRWYDTCDTVLSGAPASIDGAVFLLRR